MSNSIEMSDGFFTGADVIHQYTRAQAIADGVLVDVTEMAREAGFAWPVALTRAVWEDCVAWSEDDNRRQTVQHETGRLWDVLWMAHGATRSVTKFADRGVAPFQLVRIPRGGRATRPRLVSLKLVMGVGDDGGPVLTIMQPTED